MRAGAEKSLESATECGKVDAGRAALLGRIGVGTHRNSVVRSAVHDETESVPGTFVFSFVFSPLFFWHLCFFRSWRFLHDAVLCRGIAGAGDDVGALEAMASGDV
jgi:hypothetical protein